jgi:hypothetical protein
MRAPAKQNNNKIKASLDANKKKIATSVAKAKATRYGFTELRRPTELADPYQIASGVCVLLTFAVMEVGPPVSSSR